MHYGLPAATTALPPVTSVTAATCVQFHTSLQGGVMPILFMGLMALAVLTIMGGMLFFAVYKETHTPHPPAATPEETKPATPTRVA